MISQDIGIVLKSCLRKQERRYLKLNVPKKEPFLYLAFDKIVSGPFISVFRLCLNLVYTG